MVLPADSRVHSRVGVGRFRDTPAAYEGIDGNDRPIGSTSMTLVTIVLALRRLDANSGVQALVSHTNNTGTQGGWFSSVIVNGDFRYEVADGAGSRVRATITQEIDPGQVFVMAMSYDGSTLRAHQNGEADSQAAGTAGYTQQGGARPLTVGVLSSAQNSPAEDMACLGFLGTDSQDLSAAQLSTLEAELIDNVEQGRDLDFGLSAFVPEVLYDARDLVVAGSTPAASWSDRNGNGVDLTKNGEPELVEYASRF